MDVLNETVITICWELYEQGLPKIQIAKRLGKHRETVHLWIKGIKRYGLIGFLDRYRQAKKGERQSRQVDPILKRWVWEIREREFDCCGQKIQYFLKLEHKTHLSVTKIYEILKEKYVLRDKRRKNQTRGQVPRASSAREVIQMDTMDFGELYAFTAIDIFSKEADILIAPELTAEYGVRFLNQSMQRRFGGQVYLVQTDGGPEFKREFSEALPNYCQRHRVARPYRKNEQSFIESFNRTVRKECLGWNKYRIGELADCEDLVETFLNRYHYHRPHISLGMTPPLAKKEEALSDIYG